MNENLSSEIVPSDAGKAGMSPGSLVHVSEEVSQTRVRVIHYGPLGGAEIHPDREGEYLKPGRKENSWVQIEGFSDLATLTRIGREFRLHPLVQEDILNTRHRPKLEELEDGFFLVLRAMQYGDDATLAYTQLNLVLRERALLCYVERPYPPIETVWKRLQGSQSRALRLGPDYLMYRLTDLVVDQYFGVLEDMEDHLEELARQVESDDSPEVLTRLQRFKRELLSFRKYVSPLREMTVELQRNDSGLISDACLPFLRDLEDHVLQVLDRIESLREQTISLVELHLALVSHRMNEVMKVLTVIATIFIPLTFIAGIYGMNFEHMPELKWRWGYGTVWGGMVALGIGMVIWFRRRKWF